MLRTSPAYFARKFADDPAAPLRARVLRELAGTDAFAVHPSLDQSLAIQGGLPAGRGEETAL